MTDAAKLPSVDLIDVNSSPDLTDAAKLPSVDLIDVNSSPDLTDAAKLPSVDLIDVNSSPDLTDAAKLPSVDLIDVNSSPDLTDAAKLPSVDLIDVNSSPDLTDAAKLPSVDLIDVSSSPDLTDAAKLPSVDLIDVNSSPTALTEAEDPSTVNSIEVRGLSLTIEEKKYNTYRTDCFLGKKIGNFTPQQKIDIEKLNLKIKQSNSDLTDERETLLALYGQKELLTNNEIETVRNLLVDTFSFYDCKEENVSPYFSRVLDILKNQDDNVYSSVINELLMKKNGYEVPYKYFNLVSPLNLSSERISFHNHAWNEFKKTSDALSERKFDVDKLSNAIYGLIITDGVTGLAKIKNSDRERQIKEFRGSLEKWVKSVADGVENLSDEEKALFELSKFYLKDVKPRDKAYKKLSDAIRGIPHRNSKIKEEHHKRVTEEITNRMKSINDEELSKLSVTPLKEAVIKGKCKFDNPESLNINYDNFNQDSNKILIENKYREYRENNPGMPSLSELVDLFLSRELPRDFLSSFPDEGLDIITNYAWPYAYITSSNKTYGNPTNPDKLANINNGNNKIEILKNAMFEFYSEEGLLKKSGSVTEQQIDLLNTIYEVDQNSKLATKNLAAGEGKSFTVALYEKISPNMPLTIHVSPSPEVYNDWHVKGYEEVKSLLQDSDNEVRHICMTPEQANKMLIESRKDETFDKLKSSMIVADEYDAKQYNKKNGASNILEWQKLGFNKILKLSATHNSEHNDKLIKRTAFKIQHGRDNLQSKLDVLKTQNRRMQESISAVFKREIDIRTTNDDRKNSIDMAVSLVNEAIDGGNRRFIVQIPDSPLELTQVANIICENIKADTKNTRNINVVFVDDMAQKKVMQINGKDTSVKEIPLDKYSKSKSDNDVSVLLYAQNSRGGDYGELSKTGVERQYIIYSEVPEKTELYQHLKRDRSDESHVTLVPLFSPLPQDFKSMIFNANLKQKKNSEIREALWMEEKKVSHMKRRIEHAIVSSLTKFDENLPSRIGKEISQHVKLAVREEIEKDPNAKNVDVKVMDRLEPIITQRLTSYVNSQTDSSDDIVDGNDISLISREIKIAEALINGKDKLVDVLHQLLPSALIPTNSMNLGEEFMKNMTNEIKDYLAQNLEMKSFEVQGMAAQFSKDFMDEKIIGLKPKTPSTLETSKRRVSRRLDNVIKNYNTNLKFQKESLQNKLDAINTRKAKLAELGRKLESISEVITRARVITHESKTSNEKWYEMELGRKNAISAG
ncbi:hypothetical protein L1D61_26735 [Vibrio mediterranei]|nr:hypothetical protein [Vibrio mediterranei]